MPQRRRLSATKLSLLPRHSAWVSGKLIFRNKRFAEKANVVAAIREHWNNEKHFIGRACKKKGITSQPAEVSILVKSKAAIPVVFPEDDLPVPAPRTSVPQDPTPPQPVLFDLSRSPYDLAFDQL